MRFLEQAAAIILLSVPVLLWSPPAAGRFPEGVTEDDFKRAIQFYTEGGRFVFRLVPAAGADAQTEWTVLLLSSAKSGNEPARLGDVEPGEGSTLNAIEAALNVQIVMNHAENRAELFRRFGEGIDQGVLRARVIKMPPIEGDAPVPLSKAVDLKSSELFALRDLEQAR